MTPTPEHVDLPPPAETRRASQEWPAGSGASGGLRILLLEDSEPQVELTKHTLKEAGLEFEFVVVDTRDAFERELKRSAPSLILSDYSLPGFDGVQALEIAQKAVPTVPFIFVTGVLGEEVAIEMLKLGATDYVLKTHLARLGPSVRRALREADDRRERELAEEKFRTSHEQLRALTAHLQSVREEERTKIAREVHDELGQAMTGLKLDLSWVSGKLRGSVALQRKIKGMIGQIDATIHTVRRIATELRPGILDSLGLVAAIEWQAADFQQRTGIKCEFSTDVHTTPWSSHLSTVCFRIFQETLTNIIRHAKASRVQVRLTQSEGALVLTVRDNGRGIAERDITTRSIGLIGMKERASQVGGEVFFFGLPSFGTTVTTRLPIAQSPAETPATAPASVAMPHETAVPA